MKKMKLLSSLATIGIIGATVPVIVSGCSCNSGGDNTKLLINFVGTNTVASGGSVEWTITLQNDDNTSATFKSLVANSNKENVVTATVTSVKEGDTTAKVKIDGISNGDAIITLNAEDTQGRKSTRQINFTVQATYTLEIDHSDQFIEVEQIKTANVHFYCDGQPIKANITGAVSLDPTKLSVNVTKDKQNIILMGIAYGASDLVIVGEDAEGHVMSAVYTIEVTDVRPYFVLKNNDTELWEVLGRNHDGSLHDHKVRDLTDHDIVVNANTLKTTVESKANSDDGNESCFIL